MEDWSGKIAAVEPGVVDSYLVFASGGEHWHEDQEGKRLECNCQT